MSDSGLLSQPNDTWPANTLVLLRINNAVIAVAYKIRDRLEERLTLVLVFLRADVFIVPSKSNSVRNILLESTLFARQPCCHIPLQRT
jgi:hypothetical protein